MYETLLYEEDNGVASIALNRPEKLNAFDSAMHDELYAALRPSVAPRMKNGSVASCCVARAAVSPRAPTWRRS